MRCLIMIDEQKCKKELEQLLSEYFEDCMEKSKICQDDFDFIFTDHDCRDSLVIVFNRDQHIFFSLRKSCLKEDFIAFKQAYIDKLQAEMTMTFVLDQQLKYYASKNKTLLVNDIVYVECFCHELIVHTYRHEYVVKMTMKDFLQKVEALCCFVRIHRTYAINMNYIYRIDKDYVYMIDEDIKNELKISQKYKKDFLHIFRHYLLPYKKDQSSK